MVQGDDVDDGGRCLVTFQYQESRGTLNEIEAVVMKAMSKMASIVSNWRKDTWEDWYKYKYKYKYKCPKIVSNRGGKTPGRIVMVV